MRMPNPLSLVAHILGKYFGGKLRIRITAGST